MDQVIDVSLGDSFQRGITEGFMRRFAHESIFEGKLLEPVIHDFYWSRFVLDYYHRTDKNGIIGYSKL